MAGAEKIKVLVTGGTGYIGSHTVVELIEQGFEPIVIDNLDNSSIDVLDRIKEITGVLPSFSQIDLLNLSNLSQFFNQHNDIQAVIHFAAHKAVGESVEKPLKYYQNNLTGLINLLQCMQEKQIKQLVFSSSCTVYGEPDKLPVNENSPIKKATSPYGNTKQIGEEIIADQVKASSLRCIALRYFNPVGAHDSGIIGELPNGVPNNLVPFITQSAAGLRGPLKVFGNDYNTPDGTCIRDYIHVSDVAEAHIYAMKRMLASQQEQAFEVFNIGTGKGTSVLEAIKAFENSTGVILNYTMAERRSGDVEKVYADTSLANEKLGWKAQKDINEMMKTAWKWQNHLNTIMTHE